VGCRIKKYKGFKDTASTTTGRSITATTVSTPTTSDDECLCVPRTGYD
jgi:hypothetical protein